MFTLILLDNAPNVLGWSAIFITLYLVLLAATLRIARAGRAHSLRPVVAIAGGLATVLVALVVFELVVAVSFIAGQVR